ncbi:MAG: hypothetical protein U0457_08035 [Candidatus Sericytochromatia bacterium]
MGNDLNLGVSYSSVQKDPFLREIGLKNPNDTEVDSNQTVPTSQQEDTKNALPDLNPEIDPEDTLQVNTQEPSTGSVKVETNLPFIDTPIGKIKIKQGSTLNNPNEPKKELGDLDFIPPKDKKSTDETTDISLKGEDYSFSVQHEARKKTTQRIEYSPLEKTNLSITQEDNLGTDKTQTAEVTSEVPIIGTVNIRSSQNTNINGNLKNVNVFNWKVSDKITLNQETTRETNQANVTKTTADYTSDNLVFQANQEVSTLAGVSTTNNQVKLAVSIPSSELPESQDIPKTEDDIKTVDTTKKEGTEKKQKSPLGTQIEIVKGEKKDDGAGSQNLQVSATHTFGTEKEPIAVFLQDTTKTGEVESLKFGYKSKKVNSSYESSASGKTITAEYLPQSDASKYIERAGISRTLSEAGNSSSIFVNGQVTDHVGYNLTLRDGGTDKSQASLTYSEGAFKAEVGLGADGKPFGNFKFQKDV